MSYPIPSFTAYSLLGFILVRHQHPSPLVWQHQDVVLCCVLLLRSMSYGCVYVCACACVRLAQLLLLLLLLLLAAGMVDAAVVIVFIVNYIYSPGGAHP